jgi:hypothetical protein
MSIEYNDPVFFSSGNGHHQPELMVAAVLHLMSHYTAHSSDGGACVKLASVIERHFKALAGLPDLAPVLRATCQQLSEQWACIVERDLPRPKKSSILSRIIARAKSGKADACLAVAPAAAIGTEPARTQTSAWATRYV